MVDQIAPFPVGFSKREGSAFTASDVVTAKKAYLGHTYVYGIKGEKLFTVNKDTTTAWTIADNSITASTRAVVSYTDPTFPADRYVRVSAVTATVQDSAGAVTTAGALTFKTYKIADGTEDTAAVAGSVSVSLIEDVA